MNRKLYRSTDGQMIAGVCAGLGKYLDMDPTVIRVLFALLAAFGGGGILLYIVLMLVMPVEPGAEISRGTDTFTAAPASSEPPTPSAPAPAPDAGPTTPTEIDAEDATSGI
jgi:phage shock protein C